MDQLSFGDAEYARKRKRTRREEFLGEMDQVVPWSTLEFLIEPHYPKAGNGRRPYPLATMLRIHLMQNWFGLSDPAMEEALYEITPLRQFARLRLAPMPTIARTAYFLATLLALASCVLAACPSVPIASRAQLAYTYDPQGNRLTLTDAAGEVTQYGYDAANRLTSVSAPGVGATTYAYDTASQLRGRTGQGGLVTDYAYDDAGRIASITHRIGSTPTLSIGYTHNANGNRIQQVIEHAGSAAETTDFEYDDADRLVRSRDGQSDTRWTLDAAGNRTLEEVREGGVLTRRTAYTVDGRDRLRTATPELPTGPPTEYAYDTNGNLLSETTGSAVTNYRWDARDRLIEQTLPGQSAI